MVDAPHIAAESNYGAGGRICDQSLDCPHVKGFLGNLCQPDHVHVTIMRGYRAGGAPDRRK